MPNIVFVCTGNLCRSPMAEGILRERWKALGRDDLVVSSMGIHGLDNSPASQFARDVCQEHGIDISAHRSRELAYDELDAAHVVFVMERVQKDFIDLFFPRLKEKVFLLAAWPEKDTRKSRIDDPMGGNIKAYRKAFEVIAAQVDRVLPLLVEYYG